MSTELIKTPELARTLSELLHIELHKMLARNLNFAPAPEDLPATHAVFLEDLRRWGLTDADTDRVRYAFWHLGPRIDRFPTPWAVIQALPVKRQPKPETYPGCNHDGLKKFADLAREQLGFGPAPTINDEENE